MDFYPLSQSEVGTKGWKWRTEADVTPKAEKRLPASRLPDKTADVPDDILNWAIECEETGRPYKLIAQELQFYRENNLPVPHLHPEVRHKKRFELRNPRQIFERNCDECSTAIKTTYSPDKTEQVFCESCYLKEVY